MSARANNPVSLRFVARSDLDHFVPVVDAQRPPPLLVWLKVRERMFVCERDAVGGGGNAAANGHHLRYVGMAW